MRHVRRLLFLPIYLLFGMVIVGCENGELKMPPDHLLGMWETHSKTYAEDSLEILPDRVRFGTATDQFTVYMISAVRERVENGRVLYSIQYHGSDLSEQELNFFYNAAEGGFITFKHQPQLRWTRKRGHA